MREVTQNALSGNLGFLGVATSFSSVLPEDGNYLAFSGAIGSNNVLSQTFADVSGRSYTMTGWVYGFGGRPSDVGFNIQTRSTTCPPPYS